MTDTITLPTYMVTRAIKALNDKDNIYYGEKEVVSRMLEKALRESATGRDVQAIDVSEMSQKELCCILGIKHVPWYKSAIFWMCMSFGMMQLTYIVSLIINM